MRLKTLFNRKYFWQNIIKSKAVLALVLGIIPILNAIFVLLNATSTENVQLADFTELSVINILGMYIIPIVVALCLLGYIFRRKSVDFINSMPLSRREIYVTNAIGGILLLVAMQVITTLLIFVESLIFTNLIIPISMIIDYFVLWTVSYLFVYTASIVAISISGNHTTMIVITCLILLLVPFTHQYITGFQNTDVTLNPGSSLSLTNNNVYITKVTKHTNYTMPYNIFGSIFKGNVTLYSTESIVKMLVLSIVYLFLGMYLFEKRKMEVSETSFKSKNMHYFVKTLTMFPIVTAIVYLIYRDFSVTLLLFLLTLVIAYSIIYDLITSRAIKSLRLGVLYFISGVIIYTLLYIGLDIINREVTVESNDIKAVSVRLASLDYYGGSNERFSDVYIEDEDLLEIIKRTLFRNENNNNYISDFDISIKLKTIKGDEYSATVFLDETDYSKVENIVTNNEEYQKEYRNIDFSNVKAVSIGTVTFTKEKMENIISKLEKRVKNMEKIDLKNLYGVNDTEIIKLHSIEKITLYSYEDHKNVEYEFPLYIDDELYLDYIKYSNEDFMSKIKNCNIIISSICVVKSDTFNIFDMHYSNLGNLTENDDLIKFLKKYSNYAIDINNLVKIDGYFIDKSYNYIWFEYYTSNIEKLNEVLSLYNVRGE